MHRLRGSAGNGTRSGRRRIRAVRVRTVAAHAGGTNELDDADHQSGAPRIQIQISIGRLKSRSSSLRLKVRPTSRKPCARPARYRGAGHPRSRNSCPKRPRSNGLTRKASNPAAYPAVRSGRARSRSTRPGAPPRNAGLRARGVSSRPSNPGSPRSTRAMSMFPEAIAAKPPGPSAATTTVCPMSSTTDSRLSATSSLRADRSGRDGCIRIAWAADGARQTQLEQDPWRPCEDSHPQRAVMERWQAFCDIACGPQARGRAHRIGARRRSRMPSDRTRQTQSASASSSS
jgi:hypothetical protein